MGRVEERFERWRSRGDAQALGDVFDALAPGLLRLAIHLVGDPAAAEDLVQQAFVTAIKRAAAWDGVRPLEPWLQGILANHARDLTKRERQREHIDLDALLARDERTPLDAALEEELDGELARAIDALEEPYRAAVLLRLRHGLAPADIAHVLGRSPGAVRVHLHRAREMLRRTLPIGLASALALLAEPARGLEFVRASVLDQAGTLARGSGGVGGVLGGVLAMKKVLVGAAAVLALVAAAWWIAGPARLVSDGAAAGVSARASAVGEGLVVPNEPTTPGADTGRAQVAADAAVVAQALQPFRCRVVDGVSGLPVPNARIAYYPPKLSRNSEIRARWPERVLVTSRGDERTHDWPWFRAAPTQRQRLNLDPILSYEGPLPGEQPAATTTSDANGDALVELPAEQAFVVVEHPSYSTRGMPPVLERTVNWLDGKTLRRETFRDDVLVVKLFRPQVLRGQLIDLEGRPLAERVPLRIEGDADGDLLANGWRSTVPTDSWTVWTSTDGSFEAEVAATRVSVRSLEPGWCVAGTAVHPVRKKRWSFANVYLLDSPEPAWIPLRRAPVVVVRSAVDEAPVREYRLLVVDLQTRWPRGLLTRVRSEDGRARLLDSDDFQARPAAIKPLAVHVLADGFAPGFAECAQPDRATEIVIRLQPGACPMLAGRVLDAGRPVPGASVLITPSDRWNWSCEAEGAGAAAETDAEGRFSICAPPGGWVVTVAHAGRSQCRFVEHPGSDSIAIDLARDTVVEFSLEGPPGTSFDGVWAHISSGREVNQALQVDEHGHACFGSLPPGRYTARVRGEGAEFDAAPGDDEFELASGMTRTVRFTRDSAGGPRRARLVVDGLTALAGWKARAVSLDAPWLDVESDGSVPIDVGQPSELLIQDPEGFTYQFQVPFELAGEPVLRLALGRGGFRGVLRRFDGRPQTARLVVASFPRDEHGLARVTSPVDREGRFRLDALPPGARTLTIRDARGNTEFDGFEAVEFISSAGPGVAGSELVIDLPQSRGADGSAEGRIVLRGLVREAGEPARGRSLAVRALRDMPGGVLALVTRATVLSDGTYVLETMPAPRHRASAWFEGSTWEQEFTLPLDVAEARQDFALR